MPLTPAQKKHAAKRVKTKRIHNLVTQFIKMPDNKDMQFRSEGDIAEARKLVQSMRVKLSRFREALRERGHEIIDFKMRTLTMSYNPDANVTMITLTKSAPMASMEKEVTELLKDLDL